MAEDATDKIRSTLILPVETPTEHHYLALRRRMQELATTKDPNAIPTIVKVLMPNPLVPDDDPVFANVISRDRGLNLLVEAAILRPVMGPRMVGYWVAIFHKDRVGIEFLFEAAGETW
jgi:hypothetical protein